MYISTIKTNSLYIALYGLVILGIAAFSLSAAPARAVVYQSQPVTSFTQNYEQPSMLYGDSNFYLNTSTAGGYLAWLDSTSNENLPCASQTNGNVYGNGLAGHGVSIYASSTVGGKIYGVQISYVSTTDNLNILANYFGYFCTVGNASINTSGHPNDLIANGIAYAFADSTSSALNALLPSSFAAALTVPSSTTILYTDFPSWTVSATSTTAGDLYEYDVQYNTADNFVAGYCGQSTGRIDSATSTATGSSTTILIPKMTPIAPIVWQGVFTNPVNGNGYPTTIYVKTCAADLTHSAQYIVTSTLQMQYGGTPSNNGGSTTTLDFVYPTSTGYQYPPFDSYVMKVDGLVPDLNYTIRYRDQVAGVTQILGRDVTDLGSNFLEKGISLPNDFSRYDFGNATSVLLRIGVTISNPVTGFNASTSGAFNMIPNSYTNASGTAINPNGTTTFNNPLPEIINGHFTGTATSTENLSPTSNSCALGLNEAVCKTPDGITDIGGGVAYGLCMASNLLLIPNCNAQGSIVQMFQNIQGDFPFNIVYGTLGVFVNAAQGVQYGTINAASPANTTLALPFFGSSITVLSSTSLSSFVGATNTAMIFKTEDAAAWVGVAWTALKIIF